MKGVPGILPKISVYVTSSWLFAANMLASFFWVRFLSFHLNGGIPRRTRIVLDSIVAFGLILLVINLFVPIVFFIDENNLYSRSYLYVVYLMIDYLLVLYSLVTYFKARANGGFLKFFPIWVYIVPILIGGVVQSLYYGISVIPTSIAVSIAGVLASLQNEMIYHENGFKHINDKFGHAMGDDALVMSARLLKSAVGNSGSVIRYAGDEFIILLNTQDDVAIEKCIAKIRNLFDDFNKNASKPYELSVSVGSHKFDMKMESVDTFINIADARMYEDKKAFYASHARMDRRKR